MQFTPAQAATLKAGILGTPALAALTNDFNTLSLALNALAAPAFVCWKPSIPTSAIGTTISYVALAAVTTGNLTQLQIFLQLNTVSFPPTADIRAFFTTTFSGALGGQGQATRDALDALYRKNTTVAEKILATGTGSAAVPATFGWEGQVSMFELGEVLA